MSSTENMDCLNVPRMLKRTKRTGVGPYKQRYIDRRSAFAMGCIPLVSAITVPVIDCSRYSYPQAAHQAAQNSGVHFSRSRVPSVWQAVERQSKSFFRLNDEVRKTSPASLDNGSNKASKFLRVRSPQEVWMQSKAGRTMPSRYRR